jgi:hypothetical protein
MKQLMETLAAAQEGYLHHDRAKNEISVAISY